MAFTLAHRKLNKCNFYEKDRDLWPTSVVCQTHSRLEMCARLHQSKNLFHNPLEKSKAILCFVSQVWRALHRMQMSNLYEAFTGFLKPEATERVVEVRLRSAPAYCSISSFVFVFSSCSKACISMIRLLYGPFRRNIWSNTVQNNIIIIISGMFCLERREEKRPDITSLQSFPPELVWFISPCVFFPTKLKKKLILSFQKWV